MRPPLRLLLIRLRLGLLALFPVSLIVFVANQALPGGALRAILGTEAADKARCEAPRTQVGLDKSMTRKYGDWLGSIFSGWLGESAVLNESLTSLLGRRVANSTVLVLAAAILSISLSSVFGCLSALWHEAKFDLRHYRYPVVSDSGLRARHHPRGDRTSDPKPILGGKSYVLLPSQLRRSQEVLRGLPA